MTYALGTASLGRQSIDAAAGEPLRAFRTKDSVRSSAAKKARNGTRQASATAEEVLRREALEEMFVTSRSRFLAMANSILRNREDAEEAVQEAFLSAHRHLRNFEGRSALKTWLTRIVLNAALMMRRKHKPVMIKSLSETDVSQDEDWTENIPDLHPNPEVIHADRETFQFIDGVLGKMKPVLRQAFTMTYYDDLSREEASAMLRISTGTFKARLFRARRQVLNRTKRAQVNPVHKATGWSSGSWKWKGLHGSQVSEL